MLSFIKFSLLKNKQNRNYGFYVLIILILSWLLFLDWDLTKAQELIKLSRPTSVDLRSKFEDYNLTPTETLQLISYGFVLGCYQMKTKVKKAVLAELKPLDDEEKAELVVKAVGIMDKRVERLGWSKVLPHIMFQYVAMEIVEELLATINKE